MKKYFTVATILIFVGILFVLSEALYTYNTPPRLSYYFVQLSKYYLKSGKTEKSVDSIQTAAKILAFKNRKIVSVLDNTYTIREIQIPQNTEFIGKYLKDIPYDRLYSTGKYDLPRIYYELAVLAYRSDEKDLAADLLNNTVATDPTLSYWHVELANYYLKEGDSEKAKTTLELCQKIDASRDHCRQYSENSFALNTPEEFGFLLPETGKNYNYESLLLGPESEPNNTQ